MQVTPEMLADAVRVLAEKNKSICALTGGVSRSPTIETIKDLRAIFGIGLKEAKDLWDAQAAPPVDPVVEVARRIVDGGRCFG